MTKPSTLSTVHLKESNASSALLAGIANAKKAFEDDTGYRDLTSDEIDKLKKQNNAAKDWGEIKVAENFNPHKIVGCYFSGQVNLGAFENEVEVEPGVNIGSGVYNTDVKNAVIQDNALVCNVNLLANTFVGHAALVWGCGNVVGTSKREHPFGVGLELNVGQESPGREISIYPEISIPVIQSLDGNREHKDLHEHYRMELKDYIENAKCNLTIIEPHARLLNTPKIYDLFLAKHCAIDAATWIENVCVYGDESKPSAISCGSIVKNSILQTGTRISDHAQVEYTLLSEASSIEGHAKVHHSIIGSNSGIAQGECIASLVGPFVGFHHQALLIAAFWPEGKGNIGYGANVGSNHTGKLPDQSIQPGEGTFFGLGCNIKFPSNFRQAPYSILASGITTLPQKLEMPFSLINSPSQNTEGLSPALNEIYPAWTLRNGMYALRRNAMKFRERNQISTETCDADMFRIEFLPSILMAKKALENAEGEARLADHKGNPIFTSKEIPEIGKNYMTESSRNNAIAAYQFFISFVLTRSVFRSLKDKDQQIFEALKEMQAKYDEVKSVLLKPEAEVLNDFQNCCETIARWTLESKERDALRGARIMENYHHTHAKAADDPVIRATREEMAKDFSDAQKLLQDLT